MIYTLLLDAYLSFLALCQLVLLAIKSMGEEVIFSMTFSPVFIFFFN